MINWIKSFFKEEEITENSKLTTSSHTFGGSVFVEKTPRNDKILKLRREEFKKKLKGRIKKRN